MKHFLLIAALVGLPAAAFAQDTLVVEGSGKTYSQSFDSLTIGLIPNRIPYGVLYYRVPGWAGLRGGQGVDTMSPVACGRPGMSWSSRMSIPQPGLQATPSRVQQPAPTCAWVSCPC